MMLSLKPRHKEEKKLSDKELEHRLNTDTAILIVLTSCFGVAAIVSLMPGYTLPSSSTHVIWTDGCRDESLKFIVPQD
jgi:hypothetical protein